MAIFWISSLLIGGLVAFWAPLGQFCIGVFVMAFVAAVTCASLTRAIDTTALVWAAVFFGAQIGYVGGIGLKAFTRARGGRGLPAGALTRPHGEAGQGAGERHENHFRSARP